MTTQNQIETTIPFSLANGGTAASLTASNGGIFYSTASAGAILSGTATAGQLLLSGSSTTPSWSTSTYPSTNAINTLLYASSANTMAALATANSGVLVTSSGGIPSISTTLPSGLSVTNLTLTTPTLGAATATSITFSPTTGGIVGTTTNNNASTGYVGEFVSSTVLVGSAVSVSNDTSTDITSISLTAGDWDVWGAIASNPAGSTTTQNFSGWTSTASATPPTQPNNGSYFLWNVGVVGGARLQLPTGNQRISISGTTTIYLTTYITFAVSTMSAYGFIGARRVR